MNRFRLKNQLSLINEEQDEDLNLSERMAKFETLTQTNENCIQKQKVGSKSTGLDRFMSFLDQPHTNSNKKLKPLPQAKKSSASTSDELNPQNFPKPRPRSSLQRNSLNKFTQFLQSQDLAIQSKVKTKRERKSNGLSKFMETLNVAERVKQEKKLGNIVSGILALSKNIPQMPFGQEKHRYLINSEKFSQIKPKSKKIKVRSHSAKPSSSKSKQFSKATPKQDPIEEQLSKFLVLSNTPPFKTKSVQTSNNAFQRKVRFFEIMWDMPEVKRKKKQAEQTDNFAFLN